MKKNSVMVKQVLMSILTAGIFTFGFTACSDELDNEVANEVSPLELSSGCGLENLEQHSYAVPYHVTAQGDWKIEFEFNEGHEICYAHPRQGHGPQEIKICVLDNWTDEQRTGEMIITDSENPQHPQVIKIGQKCNLDNGITRGADGSFVTPDKGNRIYGVGYGYNMYKPLNQALTLNPIIRIEEVRDSNIFVTEGVEMQEVSEDYTGSSFSEVTNNFKAKASASGEGWGFEGEVSASFGRNDFSNNKYEYALSTIDVKKTTAELININHNTIALCYMCNEAYANINGQPYNPGARSGRATGAKSPYDNSDEGLYKLVKMYGTHLVVSASMGGRLKYANTVDVSKVKGSYDINAFAKLSYKNSFMKASADVSDDYKKSWEENKSAVTTIVSAYGGTHETASKVSDGTKSSIDAWKASLNDIGNCKLVGIDYGTLIPLWEIVNINEKGGVRRRNLLRKFITEKLQGMMAREQGNKNYSCSTIARIDIPQFASAKDTKASATLIKDVYMSGTHVARICNEYLPQLNKKERVTVVYPVVENSVMYNLGYWGGDQAHKPYRVCSTDNGILVNEIKEDTIGAKKVLYLRNSCFYTDWKDSKTLKKEPIAKTTIENAYMKGLNVKKGGVEAPYNYSMVKIFGRIWLREWYNERVADTKSVSGTRCGTYTKSSDLNFKINNFRLATYDDYQNLLDGLKDGGVAAPATVMFNGNMTEDLTGFNVEWEGWGVIDKSGKYLDCIEKDTQMEYITRSADGKEFGHVRIKKAGSVEIVKNEYDNWAMQARLAIPVSMQK